MLSHTEGVYGLIGCQKSALMSKKFRARLFHAASASRPFSAAAAVVRTRGRVALFYTPRPAPQLKFDTIFSAPSVSSSRLHAAARRLFGEFASASARGRFMAARDTPANANLFLFSLSSRRSWVAQFVSPLRFLSPAGLWEKQWPRAWLFIACNEIQFRIIIRKWAQENPPTCLFSLCECVCVGRFCFSCAWIASRYSFASRWDTQKIRGCLQW